MANIMQRTAALTLRERNIVFVSEMLVTGLLRLTLMGPAEVNAVIEIVKSYAPDETDTFGTRAAHARLLELLSDIKRDHARPARSIRNPAVSSTKAARVSRTVRSVTTRRKSRPTRRRSSKTH